MLYISVLSGTASPSLRNLQVGPRVPELDWGATGAPQEKSQGQSGFFQFFLGKCAGADLGSAPGS
jgi:hypothetical protein